jgi:ribosome modulation factor
MAKEVYGECPGSCTHTAQEHADFDAGVAAGRAGQSADTCPHKRGGRRIDWLTGHSAGSLQHSFEGLYETVKNAGGKCYFHMELTTNGRTYKKVFK